MRRGFATFAAQAEEILSAIRILAISLGIVVRTNGATSSLFRGRRGDLLKIIRWGSRRFPKGQTVRGTV